MNYRKQWTTDGIGEGEETAVVVVATIAPFPPMHPWRRAPHHPLGITIIGDAAEDAEGGVAEDAGEVVDVDEVVEVLFEGTGI